ncbi:MAG: chemotaxis-specific protein-glutamate methyltransferase CheB [Cyclobacteriaceae bacterium]|nr:chemotaxis-specific protein-glutamate methyltransferase CheB [Cyclobacteriaceae bacterium]
MSSDGKIKTLLIEDSLFMRTVISDYLRADDGIDLVDTATNGKEGHEKAKSLQPDVVVTDMIMPEYDGLYAIKNIMKDYPVPIIVLSSLDKTNPRIFDALNEGAVDFIDKPKENFKASLTGEKYKLIPLIKSLANVNKDSIKTKKTTEVHHNHTFDSNLNFEVVLIGASTGGPGAVEIIIKRLPANLPVPVVIAQHMPDRFIHSYAERLDKLTTQKVKVAEKGEELLPSTIYVIPGTSNTKIAPSSLNGRPSFIASSKKYKEFNNPSIDCLFESACEVYGKKIISVVLTGMGRDGTLGSACIKNSGGFTIAQDENSSVVYGMPKSVVEAGAATHTVKLNDISGFIVSCF